jgi:hypothetical protein
MPNTIRWEESRSLEPVGKASGSTRDRKLNRKGFAFGFAMGLLVDGKAAIPISPHPIRKQIKPRTPSDRNNSVTQAQTAAFVQPAATSRTALAQDNSVALTDSRL